MEENAIIAYKRTMQTIYIIDDEKDLIAEFREIFKAEKETKFIQIKTEDIEMALKEIPALIVVNEDTISKKSEDICEHIRQNDDNGITPVIVLTSNTERQHRVDVLSHGATYFIKKPMDKDYIYYTVKNITHLLFMNRKVSPLTNLPGNVQIQAEMKKRLAKKEYFVMVYFDLDNFKAYNDVYGFSAGDEIIKFTARTILKNVHYKEYDNNFVGHIGGDDFMAILEDEDFEKICQNIIIEFDKQVTQYFTKEDLERGYLEVANRRGVIEEFPIVSISVAAVEVPPGRFQNTLEIGEAGAQVKHLAKTVPGSTYIADRRKENVNRKQ